jgi:drug/metabolite transporter (DMT)-like permease
VTPRTRAELALLGVTLSWGGSFLVVKDTLGALGPLTLIALRFTLAAMALALAFRGAAFALGRDEGGCSRVLPAAGIGALLLAGFVLQTAGLATTTPARSGFITSTYVAMVPLLGRVLLGRRLAPRVGFAVAGALAGLFLLTDPRGAGTNVGDWLTLGCALAFAAHLLAIERWGAAFSSRALAFAQMATVALVAAPLALALEGAPPALGLRALSAVAYLGLVCSALGFLAQTWGQRHTTATRAGLIFALESLFAALLSVALGAESLTAWQWVGGLLLVGGVVFGESEPLAAPGERGARV